jgi:hypothetical protein
MAIPHPDRIVSRHMQTASRVIDGEAVILRPMDNVILSLNETGTRIWELLERSQSVSSILRTICAEFEVDEDTAAADVAAFLTEMQGKGLIELR